MSHSQKLRILTALKWVSLNLTGNSYVSSETRFVAAWPSHSAPHPRFIRTRRSLGPQIDQEMNDGAMETFRRMSVAVREEAQRALLDYLHSTRGLQFVDADFISRNSPCCIGKIVKRVGNESNIGKSMTRFFRYHPINEFEPFFESIGLKPYEYSSLISRDMMYLTDNEMLLENYHVLCTYGFPRNKIGKIYMTTTEVFNYDYGVLQSKLDSFLKKGLNQSAIIKVIISNPNILTGKDSRDFDMFLEKLECLGIGCGCIGQHLLEGNFYDWSHMLQVFQVFQKLGCSDVQLANIIIQNPRLIFELSGHMTILLIVILLKFGSRANEICDTFLNFPQIEIGKFISNLRNCFQFLIELEMDPQDIGRIVCLHPVLLGTCSLKQVSSILTSLNAGKKRICGIIKENPLELRKWILGSRVKPLPKLEDQESHMLKMKFLLDLGFAEDSNEMRKALKLFRGKGLELQERFNCFLEAGLDRKDVVKMLKVAPQILNQSKEVIEMKIDFLVNVMRFPMSTLISFPSYLAYKTQRVKLRYSMYSWLREQGKVDPNLSLCTILSSSDRIFTKLYVNLHHEGPNIWQELKQKYSD